VDFKQEVYRSALEELERYLRVDGNGRARRPFGGIKAQNGRC
jgi:hypothetical protein